MNANPEKQLDETYRSMILPLFLLAPISVD
jgi:hypothetical protein